MLLPRMPIRGRRTRLRATFRPSAARPSTLGSTTCPSLTRTEPSGLDAARATTPGSSRRRAGTAPAKPLP